MVGDERNVQRYARACEGAISVFCLLKVCFEEKQTAFATSFYDIEQLTLAVSYPQGWDLFFFIFSIPSLFYYFQCIVLKEKKIEKVYKKLGLVYRKLGFHAEWYTKN